MMVEGPERPPVRAGPAENGAAAYTYNTSTPGAYTISATVRGAHVRGSPATVVASIAEPHAPLCALKGAPHELSVTAGAQAAAGLLLSPFSRLLAHQGSSGTQSAVAARHAHGEACSQARPRS